MHIIGGLVREKDFKVEIIPSNSSWVVKLWEVKVWEGRRLTEICGSAREREREGEYINYSNFKIRCL